MCGYCNFMDNLFRTFISGFSRLTSSACLLSGTFSMKWASVTNGHTGFILMLVMIALSYILLSFAVKKIALGVAYALWEGIGILLITLFSVVLFDEALSPMKIAGLMTLVAGIVLIKSGTRKAVNTPQERRNATV